MGLTPIPPGRTIFPRASPPPGAVSGPTFGRGSPMRRRKARWPGRRSPGQPRAFLARRFAGPGLGLRVPGGARGSSPRSAPTGQTLSPVPSAGAVATRGSALDHRHGAPPLHFHDDRPPPAGIPSGRVRSLKGRRSRPVAPSRISPPTAGPGESPIQGQPPDRPQLQRFVAWTDYPCSGALDTPPGLNGAGPRGSGRGAEEGGSPPRSFEPHATNFFFNSAM